MISYSKLSLFLLLSGAIGLQATIYLPQGTNMDAVRSSQKQVAWDIHDVLAEKDKTAKGWNIFKHLPSILWSKIRRSRAWKEINQLPKHHDLSGEAYVRLFAKHGETSMAKMAEKTANSYKPRKGMEQLVRAIHGAGVTQRLASNIGPNCLAKLDKKFQKNKCSIFSYMQPGLVVDYSQYGPYYKSKQPHSQQQLSPDGKPLNTFFKNFNSLFNKNKKVLTIFVDDKIANVKAAQEEGLVGIHFDFNQPDALQKLTTELASLGVFIKK
jgi:ribosomal protein S17E